MSQVKYKFRFHSGPNRNDKWYAYIMISPIILGFFLLLLGPLLYSAYLSLTDAGLVGSGTFIGFENYEKLITNDKTFKTVVGNSIYFMVGLVPLHIGVSLFVANLLNQKIRFVGVFRTMAFTPVITSVVVWAIVWKYILAVDYGVVNNLLANLGLERINWFYHPTLTMPMVIVTTMIKGMGLNMVLFLSALKSVPTTFYEAARIDGANERRLFFHITIPMISPTIFLALVTTCIGALKSFATIYAMTGGGPANKTSIFVFYIFKLGFKQGKMGYASAVAMILFFIVFALTVLQWSLRRRFVYNEV